MTGVLAAGRRGSSELPFGGRGALDRGHGSCERYLVPQYVLDVPCQIPSMLNSVGVLCRKVGETFGEASECLRSEQAGLSREDGEVLDDGLQ